MYTKWWGVNTEPLSFISVEPIEVITLHRPSQKSTEKYFLNIWDKYRYIDTILPDITV